MHKGVSVWQSRSGYLGPHVSGGGNDRQIFKIKNESVLPGKELWTVGTLEECYAQIQRRARFLFGKVIRGKQYFGAMVRANAAVFERSYSKSKARCQCWTSRCALSGHSGKTKSSYQDAGLHRRLMLGEKYEKPFLRSPALCHDW